MDLSIVIPVYNEQESLHLLYQAVCEAVSPLELEWEIVLVDDGSRDGSPQIMEQMALVDPVHVRVIELRRNFGQTAAIAAGIDHSDGEIVVLMDADLQNDPADIPAMLAKLAEGYDVVSGWRKERQDDLSRRLPSRIANRLISWATGVPLHDYGCTLKAYRREVIKGFRLYGEMHRFIPAYAYSYGARITEMAVQLGKSFGLTDEELVHIRRGACLHDIGKMALPDSILMKNGPLTDEERATMQQHPDTANQLLSGIPSLVPA
ncbi:MAG: glycosyltransferase, partial [Chloroflexi bacterium]